MSWAARQGPVVVGGCLRPQQHAPHGLETEGKVTSQHAKRNSVLHVEVAELGCASGGLVGGCCLRLQQLD